MATGRRFAIVTSNYYPRVCGVGDFSARFASELSRRGHEVAIFSRAPAAPNPVAPAVPIHPVRGRLPLLVAGQTAIAMRRYRPTDVLLQYTSQMWDVWRFGSPATVALAAQARAVGARVTLLAHELSIPYAARPDLAVAATMQRLQLAALLGVCHRAFVTTGTRAEAIGGASRLLTGRAPGIVRVGSNAMAVPRSRPYDAARPRLGVFSTAGGGKRFDVVLESFAEIARELPGAELVLIGDLGPRERPAVRSVLEGVARHPARERIRLTGSLSLEEVAREIAELDVYLFPLDTGANTRSSTLPTALACGLPTVAARGAETDLALFRDGENVAFAKALAGPAFAEAALRILRDPAERSRLSAGARQLYDEHLAWPRIVERFLADEADAPPFTSDRR